MINPKNKFLFFIVITIGLFFLSGLYYYAKGDSGILPNNSKEINSKIFSDSASGISFKYPSDWFVSERYGDEITPFGIMLSSIDLNNYHHTPGEYPDKFINVALYKTDKTASEYAEEDLGFKEVANLELREIVTDGELINVYKSDFNNGKYTSAYKRKGEYLIIIESHIQNTEFESRVDQIFWALLTSLKFDENLPEFYKRPIASEITPGTQPQSTGFLTLPFYKAHKINAYMDLDGRLYWVKDYIHRIPWDERITGWRLGYAYDGHKGTDYNLTLGTKVAVAAQGSVSNIINNVTKNTYPNGPKIFGNLVTIDHSNSYQTLYAHLKFGGIQVSKNDQVRRGEYIAQSGNTGYSSGPHLHFEVRKSNVATPPYENKLWTTNPPTLPKFYTQVSGFIQKDTTWTKAKNPYVVDGSVIISKGATLTIDPGVIVKFRPQANFPGEILVYGNLVAKGTAQDKVYFTSFKDDSVGGDTNGDGDKTKPAPGDYKNLKFSPSSNGNLNNVVQRYGGLNDWVYCNFTPGALCAAFVNDKGNLTVSNSSIGFNRPEGLYNAGSLNVDSTVFKDNGDYGIYNKGGISKISSSEFYNNSDGILSSATTTITRSILNNNDYGVKVEQGQITLSKNNFINNKKGAGYISSISDFRHSGNISSGSGINGFVMFGSIDSDTIWRTSDLAYVVHGLSVKSGAKLVLDQGAVVKLRNNTLDYSMFIDGELIANGTQDNKVYFTSFKDDSIKGDTNGDGNFSSPKARDWRTIGFYPGSLGKLYYSIIRYGGSHSSQGALSNYGGIVSIMNSEIIANHSSGISQEFGSLTVEKTKISNPSKNSQYFYGIYQFGGHLKVASSEIYNNSNGIVVTDASSTQIYHNSIYGNSVVGVYNYTNKAINAQNNYWGDTSGPYHSTKNPNGKGDKVSGNVSFKPWLKYPYPDKSSSRNVCPGC